MRIQSNSTYNRTYSNTAAPASDNTTSERNLEEKKTEEQLAEEKLAEEREAAAKEQKMQDEVLFSERLQAMREKRESNSIGTSSPEDNSGVLTRRLVRSENSIEIAEIKAKASSEMVGLRMIAAGAGDEEDIKAAKKIIRKLEKLVKRARRKLKDLQEEGGLQIDKDKAIRDNKKQLEKRIEEEIRKRQIERRARERNYLLEEDQEAMQDAMGVRRKGSNQLTPAQRAQIQMQVAAEMATADSGGAPIAAEAGDIMGGMDSVVGSDMDMAVEAVAGSIDIKC